jgi:ketosteroid isomerase-like protein
MSQENVDIARRMIRALEQGDELTLVDCCDPGCDLALPRNLLEGGGYQGHQGARQMLADVHSTWETVSVELIREVDASHDRVVQLTRSTNVGKGDAPAVTYMYAYLYKLRDGRVISFRPYPSHAEALEAVGLSE